MKIKHLKRGPTDDTRTHRVRVFLCVCASCTFVRVNLRKADLVEEAFGRGFGL